MKYFVPCHAPVIHPWCIPILPEIVHHLSHTKIKESIGQYTTQKKYPFFLMHSVKVLEVILIKFAKLN